MPGSSGRRGEGVRGSRLVREMECHIIAGCIKYLSAILPFAFCSVISVSLCCRLNLRQPSKSRVECFTGHLLELFESIASASVNFLTVAAAGYDADNDDDGDDDDNGGSGGGSGGGGGGGGLLILKKSTSINGLRSSSGSSRRRRRCR